MPEALRVAQKDPDGKMHHTSFSLRLYTKEQAEKLAIEWKDKVRQGKFEKRIGLAQSDDTSSESSSDDESNFSLVRKSIEDIALLEEGGTSCLFLGATRSGKTTLIKAMFDIHFHNHVGVLHTCSPSAKTYTDLKKRCALAPSFCKEVIDECIKINHRTDNKYDFLHIIDDCVSSKNDSMMIKLLTIGRNAGQSVLISGQELSILNAIGRSNINYVFLGKLGSSMAIEKVVKQYLQSVFPSDLSLADKIKLYEKMTSDYNWIVLDLVGCTQFITKLNK